jgi:hypothetical protein
MRRPRTVEGIDEEITGDDAEPADLDSDGFGGQFPPIL